MPWFGVGGRAVGGRPDLHEHWPHVEVYQLHPAED